jgi:hypothetical protein
MERKIDSTIDYDQSQITNSSYSHSKIVPLSGQQTVTVTPSSGVDTTWELPVQAYNLCRSYLYAKVTIPANAKAHFYHTGMLPFSSVQIFSRTGNYLLNLQENAHKYTRVCLTADSTQEELEHGGEENPLYVSNDAKSLLGGKGSSGSTVAKYREQAYLKSAAPGQFTATLQIPLSAFKNTICDVDKSILLGEIVVMKVKWAKGSDVSFLATAETDPDTGVATQVENITYSEVGLYLAIERSAAVVEALQAQVSSEGGFTMLCPYPTVYTNSIQASTRQNVSLRLNKSNASSLKAIKHTAFPGGGANNLFFDRDNTGASKIKKYYSNINNQRLQEQQIDIENNDDDWWYMKQRYKKTAVLNKGIHDNNWIHEDNFVDYADRFSNGEIDRSAYGGLDLNNEIRVDIYYETANVALDHFTIVDGIKVLNVNSRGIAII